ncbi:VOC family protein [Gordonia metallireducens]|uniref:VOC family protein n=1 Tax=Gordonia metallireducens TaxID=2897779 RepID=UPI001E466F70|nr:VOC family protein [Gordonia metallireducens]
MIPPTPFPTAIVELACADPALAARTHQTLLGVSAAPDADSPVVVGNTDLRLSQAPVGDGDADAGHRVYFPVDDVAVMHRLLARRGFPVVESTLGVIGETTPLGVAARETVGESAHAGDVTGMDHLVFTCDNRDWAVALFGGVFGLDFRLDQPIGDNARQLFFRAGDLIVEVVTAVTSTEPPTPAATSLWGVAWRSADVEATHARLSSAGLDLSEIRAGRKKGTRIFTVRERALGTRTVIIGPA